MNRSRRRWLQSAALAALGAAAPTLALARPKARVIVIGAGYGGATCAKTLRALSPQVDVLLIDARARQNALMTRLESAENQVKLRTMYNGDKVRDAFSRFDDLERRVDEAQGYADALAIGADGPKTLGEEIDALNAIDEVDAELEAMKKAMKKG